MYNFTSKNGKIKFNGKNTKIYDVLYTLYENENINSAIIDGRIVRFDNTGFVYMDRMSPEVLDIVTARYDLDLERINQI